MVDGQCCFRIELGQLENVERLYYFIVKDANIIRLLKSERYFEYLTRLRVHNLCNDIIVIVSLGKILIGCYDLFTTFEFATVNISLTMSDMEILSK